MNTMRISQLAERSGVPATTLRFYEGAGLLPADRTPAGYRVYDEQAVARLAFIGAAKQLGLSLEEIGELLTVWQDGACAQVKADLRPRIATRLEDAERRAAELAAFTASLRRALADLDALPDRAGRCDPGCGFPATPEPGPSRAAHGQEQPRWRSAPVACSLTGDAMAARAADWQRALDGAERQTIPDGLRLTLPADRTAHIAALAAAEQACCQFFDIRLHLDHPVLHVQVRAPAAGAALLDDLFGTPA